MGSFAAPKITDSKTEGNSLRLLKAEREIALLRWVGMLVWFIILWRKQPDFSLSPVWLAYSGCLALTVIAQLRLSKPDSVRMSAWLTMIGDPLLAAAICSVTGGVNSVLIPFLYFTSLAAAFRFGTRETLLILGFNFLLSILLYIYATPSETTLDKLFIVIFYNSFAAAIGTMFAGWAQANLSLAEKNSQALQHAHGRVRSMLHRLINIQEDERKSIADDLHDRMGGRLFTLQQGVNACKGQIEENSELHKRLTELTTEIRACGDDVRLLMNELRPTVLDDLGIAETLSEYVAKITEVVPFKIKLIIDPELLKWRSKEDALLFRLVQEAIFNIRKHAEADNVTIRIEKNNDSVLCMIEDDGVGFDPDNVSSGHYGLLTMEERAKVLNGVFSIKTAPNRGTQISIRLPK